MKRAPRELLPHEQVLVEQGELLDIAHSGAKHIIFGAHLGVVPNANRVCVYRHMGDAELLYLLQNKQLPDTREETRFCSFSHLLFRALSNDCSWRGRLQLLQKVLWWWEKSGLECDLHRGVRMRGEDGGRFVFALFKSGRRLHVHRVGTQGWKNFVHFQRLFETWRNYVPDCFCAQIEERKVIARQD